MQVKTGRYFNLYKKEKKKTPEKATETYTVPKKQLIYLIDMLFYFA